jgi:ketopantoate reductase
MSALLSPAILGRLSRVCMVGSGGVRTFAALVLEKSARAKVTVVLRSKYNVVNNQGWDIKIVDHGRLENWKPSHGALSHS